MSIGITGVGLVVAGLEVVAAPPTTASPVPLVWQTDYAAAMQTARRTRSMLLVMFHRDDQDDVERLVQQRIDRDPRVRELARNLVLARVSISDTASVGGKETTLFRHPAFAELRGYPGLAMVDLTDPGNRNYGRVVSIYPFRTGQGIAVRELRVLLDLPPGTLTQRTLIFAVRTHPEGPASADSRVHPVLATESEAHSDYQAAITLQGHHAWEGRFHRINGRLRSGMTSQEIVAESWPGQGLLDAAIECVRSWRQSSGHWSAVRERHAFFGYDMKRGHNGVWYATGIFANR